MAWKDLMVRVGMDSRGFKKGANDLKRDTQGMKTGMAQLATTMTKQQQQLKMLGQAGRGASNEYRKLKATLAENNKVYRSMARELTAVERAQGRVVGSAKGMGGAFKGIGGALTGGLIGGGIAGAAIMGIGALKSGISEAGKLAADFDDQMRKVAATSKATGREFEQLKMAALAMGSSTRFTASEAGEALNFMALAGWNAEQSMAGLPGVLSLAAAAGTDLASTSDILTDTMAAFGLRADQSAHAADVFAMAQSKANTTVLMLGEAMKMAGPNARAANQSLETTTTILGLFANQGVKGTMAGTAFNSILRDLKKNADDGVVAFGNMNIELYDQQGNFNDLLGLIRQMRTATSGLTTEQRDAITGGIFDERAIKGINILLNESEHVINNLDNSMRNVTGTSKEMAKTMEAGVGGSLRSLKSAWSGLQVIVFGESKIAGSWYNIWSQKFRLWTVDFMVMQKAWNDWRGVVSKEEVGFDLVKDEGGFISPNITPSANTNKGGGVPSGPSADIYNKLQNELKLSKKVLDAVGEGHKYAAEAATKARAAIKEMYETGDDGAEHYIKLLKQQVKLGGVDSSNATKTAASAYRNLQKELQKTSEYLKFVGGEGEYLAEAITMTATAMESTFKMGTSEAVKYAEKLRAELKALLAQARQGQLAPMTQIGGVRPMAEVKMPKGLEGQAKLTAQIATDMHRIKSSAAAFGAEYDALGAQIQSVSGMISQAINGEIELSTAGYRGLIDTLDELMDVRNKQLAQDQMIMAATHAAAQISGAYFESMASGSAAAGEALRGLALSALDAAQSMVMANLAAASSSIAKWAASLGPAGPIVAAAGIAALFGMVKGAIGKAKSVKLAKGGIAYGETAAVVGDNPGARFDPEVIAPLSKLQGMLETRETVGGTFRIDGADLVLAYDNAKRKTKAFGR